MTINNTTDMLDTTNNPLASLPYGDAIEELEDLVAQLERGDGDIEQLRSHVQRALLLIDHCKDRLNAVTKDVEDLIDDHDSAVDA